MAKISQTNLEHKVKLRLKKSGLIKVGDRVAVGLSGGPDSIALLLILNSLQDKMKFSLLAVHFNHKARGVESEKDEEFVRKLCQKLEIDLIVGERSENEKIKSELDARNLRFGFFEKILKSGRGVKVALAHNANDFSETLLLNLIRGAGMRGLSSISPERENFIRPLLYFPRGEILEYLKANNIKYRTDKTNLIPIFFRNKIRLKLLPELSQFNPKISESLSRTARLISCDYDFIRTEAVKALKQIDLKKSKADISFDREKWQELHPSLRTMSLILLTRDLGIIEDISEGHLSDILSLIENNRGAKTLTLPHSLRVTLKSGRIYLSAKGERA